MARLFNIDRNYDSSFLKFLSDRVSRENVFSLSRAAAFDSPDDFIFEDIFIPLESGKFPETMEDARRFVIAIYDCGYELVEQLPIWDKMYICSLYIATNKIHLWSIDIASDYYYMIIKEGLHGGTRTPLIYFSKILEWIHVWGPTAEWYDDYYLLLSWVFISRLLGCANIESYNKTMNNLLTRGDLTINELNELTVSNRDMSSWLSIHQQIPNLCGYDNIDYKKIICGADWNS